MLTALKNSIIVALMTMIMSIVIGAPAGYALSRFDFPGKGLFRLLILLTRAFPLPLLALPLAVMFIQTGLDDTAFGLALVHTTLAIPFAVLITFSLFSGIPIELEEAAWTLGCTRLTAFTKVVFPLILPGITALSDFRIRDLLERSLCRCRFDHREPHADGFLAAEPRHLTAAPEICGRLHSCCARADLHLRGAQIPLCHVGYREPLRPRDQKRNV